MRNMIPPDKHDTVNIAERIGIGRMAGTTPIHDTDDRIGVVSITIIIKIIKIIDTTYAMMAQSLQSLQS